MSERETCLKLRGNGFLFDDESCKVFRELMPLIPRNIRYLDLSDNGFEHEHPRPLAGLLSHLPSHIEKVILDHEAALSPAEQIAKRAWPEKFWILTERAPTKLGQARAILENFTQEYSPFWRFFYSLWYEEHAQASQLLHAIDHRVIDNEDDLLEEMERLPLKSPTSLLANRLGFKPYPEAERIVDDSNECSC